MKSQKYKIGETKDKEIDEYQDGDSYISRVAPKTELSKFIDNLLTNADTIVIYDKQGNEITNMSTITGTGMTVVLSKIGYEDITLTIVVKFS